MRRSGRELVRLGARACPRCEGWSLADLSALVAGEVGACVLCRELRVQVGRICGGHADAAWRALSSWRRCREGRCRWTA